MREGGESQQLKIISIKMIISGIVVLEPQFKNFFISLRRHALLLIYSIFYVLNYLRNFIKCDVMTIISTLGRRAIS